MSAGLGHGRLSGRTLVFCVAVIKAAKHKDWKKKRKRRLKYEVKLYIAMQLFFFQGADW